MPRRSRRVALVLPTSLETRARRHAAGHRTSITVLVRALLKHFLRHPQDPELLAVIKEEIALEQDRRAAVGRSAMESRYGRRPPKTEESP